MTSLDSSVNIAKLSASSAGCGAIVYKANINKTFNLKHLLEMGSVVSTKYF